MPAELPEAAIVEEKFLAASGPGGQNVNKVASAVQLRFHVQNSPSLPQPVKARLKTIAGRRMTREGELIIEAKRFRTQEQNREDARERLAALIERAATPPKKRVKTKVSRNQKRKRVEEKRRRGELKAGRAKVARD
ncbi:alternative ribosome rescue aminoacyl-tRNA hydrolase ArfB [Hyphococcus sp.]|uniref:alternative ribosome rescue aminoacyl-tRNA hydrolase ArfB n=1 Tax=Hyphococcus sp. TaxID=2038636 RepID=UPI0035C6A197